MPINSAFTPFPLGAYLGNPDNSSPTNQATFDADYASFSGLMGATPQFMASYVDQRQAVAQWAGNSQWAATSAAQSGDARSMTPVIALPLSSLASGAGSPDQQYQAFAAGANDGAIRGIVQAWAQQGFKNLVFRPGWEMNLQGPTYAGDDAQSQADWVRAFQHVTTVLRQAAAADGVNVQIVWNPGVTNYSNAEATTNLYPGDAYVDIVGADAYADIHPYSDGGATPTYHDWNTGKEDTSVAQFIADPVNRAHYWSSPAATEWSSDGSGGHSQSLASLIAFAQAHGKAFAIPEAGAGNSDAGTDVADDAAYPQWLAQQLTAARAAGVKVAFVNLWDSNGGGNYAFSAASDNKPAEAAAWAKAFGAVTPPSPVLAAVPAAADVTLGSGPDTLALQVSEDAWKGDAQFTISIDGAQVGGVQTATALHGAGRAETFDVLGNYGSGNHRVAVDFLNDAYGGSSSTDRNLYVDSATVNGSAVPGSLALLSSGTQSLSFSGTEAVPAITVGAGADTLALQVSEDAWNGDAQFTVSVDGRQVGGTQTATALHGAGHTQTVDVLGSFAGAHSVSVDFLNDAYGGSSSTDRNLYVESATIDGTAAQGASLALLSSGTQSFGITGPVPAVHDTLDLHVSEDAWQGDAQYTIAIDGTTIGGVRAATAAHGSGATQDVSVAGTWGTGPHAVAISFLNDAYGGSSSTDRNLYVDGLTYDGQAVNGAPAALMSNGTDTFTDPGPLVTSALTVHMSEDAWQGDAQYAISIDGGASHTGTVTALRAAGASQAVSLSTQLAAGTHDVAVSFLNDAYGGTSSTDRNLYVQGVDVNNTAVAGTSASLFSNGTAHLHIVVPAS